MTTRYENDVVAWAAEQAALIRAGRLNEIDLEHIAEEILDVGKSEQRELASRMAVLLMHLLKWAHQPSRQSNSWMLTIAEQRKSILRRIDKSPSLKNVLSDPDWLADAWLDARNEAAKETGIGFDQFPFECSWDMSQVLGADWLPEPSGQEFKPSPER